MGGGSWTKDDFTKYSTSMHRTVTSDGSLDLSGLSAQQVYVQRGLDTMLNPLNVMRECRDSEEHPNTIPVILALDVTGSMGHTAVEVASKLNTIMTELYKSVKDIELMIMGIGDFAYDQAPLQVSQFESDIRIAEQLDKIYFEGGGGPNLFESYTAAWKFAVTQTDLDCWKRGKRGIIITMGDEQINPYIPEEQYRNVTGVKCDKIDTDDLFEETKDKYDVYHLIVNHYDDTCHSNVYIESVYNSWKQVISDSKVSIVKVDDIKDKIVEIITKSIESRNDEVSHTGLAEITW